MFLTSEFDIWQLGQNLCVLSKGHNKSQKMLGILTKLAIKIQITRRQMEEVV